MNDLSIDRLSKVLERLVDFLHNSYYPDQRERGEAPRVWQCDMAVLPYILNTFRDEHGLYFKVEKVEGTGPCYIFFRGSYPFLEYELQEKCGHSLIIDNRRWPDDISSTPTTTDQSYFDSVKVMNPEGQ